MTNERESWHLSKTVTISVIVALFGYAIVLIWYASEMNSTVAQQGRDIQILFAEQQSATRGANAQAVQLARIEENTRNVNQQLAALTRQLERQYNLGSGQQP